MDFVKKYKIDLNTISDVTEVLQKAIDELPDDGVLFLQDGTYPLAGRIVFKENITFKLSDNAILLNCSQDKNPMMAYNHPYKHNKAEGNSNIIIEGGIWDMNGQLDESGTPKIFPMRSPSTLLASVTEAISRSAILLSGIATTDT